MIAPGRGEFGRASRNTNFATGLIERNRPFALVAAMRAAILNGRLVQRRFALLA